MVLKGQGAMKCKVSKTWDEELICTHCIGDRAGHSMLDDFEGRGLRVFLDDHIIQNI